MTLTWRESWELFSLLLRRDLSQRYKGTLLGYCWALANPLVMVAVFSFVFSKVLQMSLPNYPLFVLAAYLPWKAFASALEEGTLIFFAYAPLVKNTTCPRVLLPLLAVTSNFLHHLLVGVLVCALFVAAADVDVLRALGWLLPIMACHYAFAVGIVLMTAPLQVLYRDTATLLSHFLSIWFFLTPIFYSLKMVQPAFLPPLYWNPMTLIIEAYRNVLYAGQPPDLAQLGGSALAATLFLGIGTAVFRRLAWRLPEELP